MKWARLTTKHLSILAYHVDDWLHHYEGSQHWLHEQPDFRGSSWYEEIPELANTSVELVHGDYTTDLENSKRLFRALRSIPRSLATDQAFWAYLTHVTFWDYMRSRWRDSVTRPTVRERYLFGDKLGPHRALVRNGISRLWWYAYITYDSNREDPFELTEVLLRRISVAQAILERSWSSNPVIVRAVLSAMQRAEEDFPGEIAARKVLRDDLQGYINQVGGVTVLDALSSSSIEEMAYDRIVQVARRTA